MTRNYSKYTLRIFLLSGFMLVWGAPLRVPARISDVPAVTVQSRTVPPVSEAGGNSKDNGAVMDSSKVRQPFWSGTFYKAGGGMNLHFSTLREYRPGHDFTLAFGKKVGNFSTIRLSGTVESYFIWNDYRQSSRRAWLGEANLLYGLEVDNFWNGGKVSPIFELSPFAGAGFDLGRSKGKWYPNGNVQFGIELGLKLSDNLYFTLEPVGKYYFHKLEDIGESESTEYSASVTAGLRYKVHNLNKNCGVNLDRHLMMEENPFMNLFFLDNTFYRMGAGVNIQKSTFANSYRPGLTYDIAAGKKLSRLSSVMLKIVRDQGHNKHKNYDVDIFEGDVLYGFDLTTALYGYNYNRVFNVGALAGGGIDFININDEWRSNANLQAGADFNVQLGNSFSIYLDPIAKIYLLDNKELIPDRTFSLELSAVMGVQYTISRREYRNSDGSFILDSRDAMRALALSERKLDRSTGSITDNSYVTFLGGSAFRSATRRTLTPGFHTGIEFGKNLNRYQSLALDLEYDNFRCDNTSRTVESYGVELLHSMNLTNLSSAKRGFHVFDLKTVFGLGLNQFYNRSFSGLAGVASLGVEADVNASEKVTFVFRPLAKGYYGHVTDETSVGTYGLSGHLAAGVRINMTNRNVPDYKKNKRKAAPTGETKYGFNALQLALQSRHLPSGAEHTRKFFFDNNYVSAGYSMENVAYNSGVYDWSNGVTLRYGNRYWKNNSLMAALTAGTVRNRITQTTSSYNELEFEHSFHLTSYIHGFDPNRTFEVSTVEGIGVNAVNDISDWRFCGNIKLGLDLNLRLSRALSLFLDPYFKIYTDNIDGDWAEKGSGYQFGYNTTHGSHVKPVAENWRNFDFGYGGTAGLRLSLTSETTYKIKVKENRRERL